LFTIKREFLQKNLIWSGAVAKVIECLSPALQAQSPEFKSQCSLKKRKKLMMKNDFKHYFKGESKQQK
jgi:hypothetical protein